MLAVIVHAVRTLFARSTTRCDAGWQARFLPTDLAELRHERADARFNPQRDFSW